MSSDPKKAPKKTTKKPAVAPRQLWAVLSEGHVAVAKSKRIAQSLAGEGDRVVGPYILAERVREK